jgi:hypothetical protein
MEPHAGFYTTSRDVTGVSFYEHLFDEKWMRPLVIPWLHPEVIRDHWSLWEQRLPPEDVEEIKTLVKNGGLATAWGPLQAPGSTEKPGQGRPGGVADTRD